ncbi:MAG: RNA 2',3'-cyclic phosphodiesterase [Acidobacteriota bacterium]
MRSFVALPLPSVVRRGLIDRTRPWRGELPQARWIAASNLHVTLRFLGELGEDGRRRLEEALHRHLQPCTSFSLQLVDGGSFGGRVLWAGVEPVPPLMALKAAVDAAVREALDHGPEARPFRPHVTVARCRRPWPRGAREAFVGRAAGAWGKPFRALGAALFESLQEPGGVRYRSLSEVAFQP